MSEPAESAENAAVNLDDEILFLRRKRHGLGDAVSGLNLTAMMDIMTILLVYLIKVYADAPESITLNDNLRPPISSATENMVPSVSVMITKTGILVEQKLVLTVEAGQVLAEDPSARYQPLAQALSARVDIIEMVAEKGGSPFDGNLMLIVDEDVPYDLVSNVLYHAGKVGFAKYQLVVQRGAASSSG